LVLLEACCTGVGWVDDHDHSCLTVLGLGTVDCDWVVVGDWDGEGWCHVGCVGDWDEAGVELAGWLACLVGIACCSSVVLVQEGELDSVTGIGLDGQGAEDELLVASDIDVDGLA